MSNETKQTAMDWFLENLKEYSTPSLIEIDWDEFNQLFEQAKAMEKEQIKNAYNDAAIDATYGEKFKNFEQYYNETYGDNQSL